MGWTPRMDGSVFGAYKTDWARVWAGLTLGLGLTLKI